jgi:hypothetical protein
MNFYCVFGGMTSNRKKRISIFSSVLCSIAYLLLTERDSYLTVSECDVISDDRQAFVRIQAWAPALYVMMQNDLCAPSERASA